MKLRFKTKAVRNWEKNHETNLYAMMDPTLDNTINLIRLGMSVSEDDACDILDKELETEDRNRYDVFTEIVVALNVQGFFEKGFDPKSPVKQLKLRLKEMNAKEKAMDKAMEKAMDKAMTQAVDKALEGMDMTASKKEKTIPTPKSEEKEGTEEL